ncbi:MAG TPA: hypothetical protein PLO50_11455 [Nitrospira sp.]|nr:hypothetical protein [Nitrospira sp.]
MGSDTLLSSKKEWLEANLAVEQLGLMDLIRYEVLKGVLREAQCHAAQKAFWKFRVNEMGMIELAIAAAAIHRRPRAAGRTIQYASGLVHRHIPPCRGVCNPSSGLRLWSV